MKTNKLISWTLILSQVAFALAQTASADFHHISPERELLQHAIAIQGQGLETTEAQAQMKNAVAAYMATASTAGQEARMEQALVELNIYTPEQAQSFVADASATAERIQNLSVSEQADAMTVEMSRLMNPSGAQFSACGVSAIGVFGGFITGALLLNNQVVGSARANAGQTLCAVSFVVGIALWISGC